MHLLNSVALTSMNAIRVTARFRLELALFPALALLVGCGNDAACTEGMSVVCACTDGRSGAQVCRSGEFEECTCTSGPGDDAGVAPGNDGGTDAGPSTMDAGEDADAGPNPDGAVSSDAGVDAGSASGHVLHLPVDDARVLVSDVGGDLYPTLFTYELWVYFDRVIAGLDQTLLLAGDSSGNIIIRIHSDDTLYCTTRSTSFDGLRAILDDASTHVTAGEWHHIACVSNGSDRLELYMDGIQRAVAETSGTMQVPAAGTTLGIGQGTSPLPAPNLRFQGFIDEVRISNAQRYTGPFTPPRHLALDSSTVALFRFDEGTGMTTMDEVGPGRHAAMLEFGATWAPE